MTQAQGTNLDAPTYARMSKIFKALHHLSADKRKRKLERIAKHDPSIATAVERLLYFHDLDSQHSPENCDANGFDEVSKSAVSSTSRWGKYRDGLRQFINSKFFLLFLLVSASAGLLHLLIDATRSKMLTSATRRIVQSAEALERDFVRDISNQQQYLENLINSPNISESLLFIAERRVNRWSIDPDQEPKHRGILNREMILKRKLCWCLNTPADFIVRDPNGTILATSISKAAIEDISFDVVPLSPRLVQRTSRNLASTKESSTKECCTDSECDLTAWPKSSSDEFWFHIPFYSEDEILLALIDIRAEQLTRNLQELSRLMSFGDTGEALVFDKYGYAISPARFTSANDRTCIRQVPLCGQRRIRVTIPPSSSSICQEDTLPTRNISRPVPLVATVASHIPAGNFGPAIYRSALRTPSTQNSVSAISELDPDDFIHVDYRGTKCLAATRFLRHSDLGLQIKVDVEEVAAPIALAEFTLWTSYGCICFIGLVWQGTRSLQGSKKSSPRALRIGESIGQYRILEILGEGGMGIVYKAEHRLLGRVAAIKTLKLGMIDELSRQRFDREVRLVSKLRSTHTVRVYDYGFTERGEPYYAMELLEGINLFEHVLRFGPFEIDTTIKYLDNVSESLQEAHSLGIVHGDVTPQNLVLSRDLRGMGNLVLIDFGLAKNLSGRVGQPSEIDRYLAGDPRFMAPEKLRNPLLTSVQTDVYALGGVAFFMLTGEFPFANLPFAQLLEKLEHQPQIGSVPRSNPLACNSLRLQRLASLIFQSLSANVDSRPSSITAFRHQLTQIS